jgi:hypothetical protein
MSKLGALVAIPLGLFAIKQLQKQFPDEKDPKPVITESVFPEKLQLTPLIPGGAAKATGPTVPLGMGTDVVPFFPKSAETAGKEFAAKDPFAGLKDLPKFGDISSLNFQTGLFDPEVQARLRARK